MPLSLSKPIVQQEDSFSCSQCNNRQVHLRQCGLHVAQVHSDRAREFRAKASRSGQWRPVYRKTAGGDSTAELAM